MSNNNSFSRTALVLCGLAATGYVSADDFHYINMHMGDRAAGMAGAYTAVSDDPSGLFYNPAGISYMGTRNLSASMNAYYMTDLRYKGVLGGGDWERDSGNLVPNYFGIAQPFGKGVIGFSYAVTDSLVENQDSVFYNLAGTNVSQFTLNLNNEESTYKIGPSYARAINDSLSLGATLYLHMRDTETIFNQNILLNDNTYEWSNQYVQSSETGLEPVIGVIWSPLDKLSLALTMRTTTLMSASLDTQYACSTDIATGSACTSTTPTPALQSSDKKRSYPLSTTIGIAFFPDDRQLYSIDFDYHTSTDDADFRDREATWNIKAGMEYYVYSNWAVRAGLFTNNANTPEITAGSSGQDDHVNLYGFSLSGSRFSRNSSITVGISYASGTGEAQPFGDSRTVDLEADSMNLFLSTSYSY